MYSGKLSLELELVHQVALKRLTSNLAVLKMRTPGPLEPFEHWIPEVH